MRRAAIYLRWQLAVALCPSLARASTLVPFTFVQIMNARARTLARVEEPSSICKAPIWAPGASITTTPITTGWTISTRPHAPPAMGWTSAWLSAAAGLMRTCGGRWAERDEPAGPSALTCSGASFHAGAYSMRPIMNARARTLARVEELVDRIGLYCETVEPLQLQQA